MDAWETTQPKGLVETQRETCPNHLLVHLLVYLLVYLLVHIRVQQEICPGQLEGRGAVEDWDHERAVQGLL